MSNRETLISQFLQRTGRGDWQRKPLSGDASQRRYERLRSPDGRSLILMDADPQNCGSQKPFATIANYLRTQGVSAPAVLGEDLDNGLLLIEDLGNDLFFDVIAANPSQELPLYNAATDLLAALHKAPVPKLEPLGPRAMAELSGLVINRYLGGITGAEDTKLQRKFENQFEDILRQNVRGDVVFVHRDFHAQNLLWLPDRERVARVGVIDFQDARSGHRAYDLVSLLQDVRRDVPPAIEMQMIDRYLQITGVEESGFRAAYSVIGLQRNLRILGVFARLSLDFGKTSYLDLMPRVWRHVRHGLEEPAVASLADWLLEILPEPTPENLAKLRP